MTETEIQKRSHEDSLAPVELDRLTIEEEAAFMNRGKGKQLMSAALVVGALAVGGGFFMNAIDREQGELQRGLAAAQLGRDHVEAYLHCAAPSVATSALDSVERIHGAIESVVERRQKASGNTLARCTQQLTGLVPALATASVGAEEKPALTALQHAAAALTKSAAALSSYLDDPAQAYDFVQATGLIDRVARAANDAREQDRALRTKLAER
jgi:hypothetical protein